ncbi:MAG: hypothetical protein SchgKO_25090 [Schleiferiaceae bacterium]
MSVLNNLTGKLWGGFAPRIAEIQNRVSQDKISLQVYPSDYFQNFNPNAEFTKWASVEVSEDSSVPEGLQLFEIPAGTYAIFDYVGSSADSSIFQYIYSQWIPNSKYQLDDRPHFEVLGSKYKNNDPTSEEEIWIPVVEK